MNKERLTLKIFMGAGIYTILVNYNLASLVVAADFFPTDPADQVRADFRRSSQTWNHADRNESAKICVYSICDICAEMPVSILRNKQSKR